MAARWSEKEENKITCNTGFMTANTCKEAVLCNGEVRVLDMDSHSCLDPSILAIFEDSAVVSEAKSRLDEENESTLLTALADILDSVDDETLSPFDTLPDTGLFSDPRLRDDSQLRKLLSLARAPVDKEPHFCPTKCPSPSIGKVEAATTDQPRWSLLALRAHGSSSPTAAQQSDGEEEEERIDIEEEARQGFTRAGQDTMRLLNSVMNDHGYYSTVSLVDLVNLMHPYCLKVVLDEGEGLLGAPRQKASLAAGRTTAHGAPLDGEVWRYTEPGSDESDGELDVDGSGDEVPSAGGMETEGGGEQGAVGGRPLRGVLVRWDVPKDHREKKRVTFGPVLVTSYDLPAPEEPELNVLPDLSELTSQIPSATETATSPGQQSRPEGGRPEGTNLPVQVAESSLSEPRPQLGEAKPRPALSLQQYRLLRQCKTLPLVAKPENYTTKWPSLPETPKELPPIPCLQSPGHAQRAPEVSPTRLGPQSTRTKADRGPIPSGHVTTAKTTSLAGASVSAKGVGANGSTPVRLWARSPPAGARLKAKRPSVGAGTARGVGGLVGVRAETVSPASPLRLKASLRLVAGVDQSRPGSERRGVAVSSDPPNPALVPHPGPRPFHDGFVGADLKLQKDQPPHTSQVSPAPEPERVHCKPGPSLKGSGLLEEIQRRFPIKQPTSETPAGSTEAPAPGAPMDSLILKRRRQSKPLIPREGTETSSEGPLLSPISPVTSSPSSIPSLRSPTPAVTPHPEMERAERATLGGPAPLQPGCTRVPMATCDTVIEATDVTSLLERFEETQAKEGRGSEGDHEVSPMRSPDSQQLFRTALHPSDAEGVLRMQGSNLPGTQEKTCQTEVLDTPEAPNNPTVKPPRTPESITTPGPDRPSDPGSRRTPAPCDAPEPLSPRNALGTRDQAPAQPRWRPLTPVSPQSKPPATHKPSPPKAIQIIEPRPLPPKKVHPLAPKPPASPAKPRTAVSVTPDHDYCLTPARPETNVLHIGQPITNPPSAPGPQNPSEFVLKQQPAECGTFPETELPSDSALPSVESSPSRTEAGTAGATQEERASVRPPPSPPGRGRRMARRYRTRSSCSDSSSRSPSLSSSSSSSSRSCSPPKKRFRPRRSESGSCSSSCSCSQSRSPASRRYRLPYPRSRSRSWSHSRSKSRSWSRSRSRSHSPSLRASRRRWSGCYRSGSNSNSRKQQRHQQMRDRKLKAIDERRVVYVGRVGRTMTHAELRERFSLFGEVEECTLHFRDRGDHYGFVTFYNMEDAFAAIEKGYKLRRPDELPFDLCFGGRRQFCKSTYADLDSNREEVDLSPAKSKFEEIDFDTLLKQAQHGLKR